MCANILILAENVAIASSVTEAVAGIWEKERTLYYAKDFNHVYTNFTQIIWKNTKEVGCAVGICGPGSFDPHHVCTLSPPLTRRSDLWMPCRLSVTSRASIAHVVTFPVKPRTPFISVLPKTQTYTCFFHPVEMIKTHCEAKGVALLSAHIPLLRKRTVFFCKIFRHL